MRATFDAVMLWLMSYPWAGALVVLVAVLLVLVLGPRSAPTGRVSAARAEQDQADRISSRNR